MNKFEFDYDSGDWLPNRQKLKWTGSFWDVVEKAAKPYHEVELAKQHLKRIATEYQSLTQDQRINGERAARYLACMHRDYLSPTILAIVREIEGRFERTGMISGNDLGIVRRCYWQKNKWKVDWKFPEEPYLAKGERPGRKFYGAHEKASMTNQATERTQNYLTSIRRLALDAGARSVVESIEEKFLREGSLTKHQVDSLQGCSLYTNGQGSLPDLRAYLVNYQAVPG